MKAAYNNRKNGFRETSEGIDFGPECVTAEELRLARTKEAILQKLIVIFGQHERKPQPRAGCPHNL